MNRKNILKILPAILLFVSCGVGNPHYEQTIADAVQTREGVKYDLNFKVLKLSHHATINATDSIRILRQEFEAKIAQDIAFAEESLKAYEMIAAIGHDAETNLRISEQKNRIDSLRNAQFDIPESYAEMGEGVALANVFRCTYTIDIPAGSGKVTAEETFDFFLSPDGSKCYRKIKMK